MITDDTAGGEASRRLYVYNGGFLTQKRPRRILSLAGWDIRLGQPGEGDWVGVWGKSPTAHRGEGVAARKNAPILRVEDALLRSVLPGRSGSPALGLLLDKTGVHFDSAHPSDIETLLATHPLDDTHLLNRARAASDWIRRAHLSKYNAFLPGNPVPNAPYVLVIDQTRGDASIAGSGANADRFAEMLYYAQDENPGQKIVIKTHPETQDGHRVAILINPAKLALSPCLAPRSARGICSRGLPLFTPSVPVWGSRRFSRATNHAFSGNPSTLVGA